MLLRMAIRNLSRNTRRTVAILATVALGVGALFLLHGFNTGIMNQYRDNTIHARYGHGQINTQGYRGQAHAEPWRAWIDDWPALAAELRALPGVTRLFPRVEFAALLRKGKVSIAGRGQGVDGEAEADFFTTLNIEQGVQLRAQADGILLGRGLADALDVRVGDAVTVAVSSTRGAMNERALVVTGIFHTGAADFDNTMFRVQLARAQALLDTTRVETIAVALDRLEAWSPFQVALATRHPALEATSFAKLDEIYYQHSVDWLNSQFGVVRLVIVLIVVLGIFNNVSAGILERKQEIGNLRANGETVTDVVCLLACEGTVLGLAGSLLGCALAWVLDQTALRHGILMPPAPGITRQFHVYVELQTAQAFATCAIGMAATLCGTLTATWRVARMTIAEALRAV